MANILIAGDSWGIGVYQHTNGQYHSTGQGIQTLLEPKFSVTNVSQAGCSNWDIAESIKQSSGSENQIIFLQTDIFREQSYHAAKGNEVRWRWLKEEFIIELLQYSTLESYINNYFLNLYNELSLIARSKNTKIICIGGWSDLHPDIDLYDNLVPLIPSVTQLIIPSVTKNVYISDFEYFTQLGDNMAFMNKFGGEFKQITIDSALKFGESCRVWNDVHPDLHGYQTIVESLLVYFGKNI
jgi:hypothetical protein